MSGNGRSPRGEHRSSALWGTGNRGGDSRSNALWGKGGRGLVTALVAVLVVAAPLAAGASKDSETAITVADSTYIDPILLAKAATAPDELVKVIIQSDEGMKDARVAYAEASRDQSHDGEELTRKLPLVGSVAVELEARKMSELAGIPGLTVTYDARVKLSGSVNYTSKHLWPTASGVKDLWRNRPASGEMPTIAIVDSGIDKNRADFDGGARIIDQVVITKLEPNSPGDGRGHGTFVAGIAAGSAPSQAGAAPQANLISLDVMDDTGMARTSDVIAAAEWIYQNRKAKNIKVANFSLHSTMPSNFTNDPLDKAVEKLWFGGVTVVVAAGNYGNPNGRPSGVPYAPGNDPFVITVGAVDLEGTTKVSHHEVPNWSAYGYTLDGFRKPEVAAAGRYMVGPIPAGSTLAGEKRGNLVSGGYIRLSGTSFATPVVSGAAAQLLIEHPDWTPDQVKGALMKRARFIREAWRGEAGVGEINAARSTELRNPPDPNAALNKFLKTDPVLGTTEFDGAAWYAYAKANRNWDASVWGGASWSDVSWSDASWADVSWSDVSWSDVSWSDVLAAADVSWEDAAAGENGPPEGGDYIISEEESSEEDSESSSPALSETPAASAPAAVAPAAQGPQQGSPGAQAPKRQRPSGLRQRRKPARPAVRPRRKPAPSLRRRSRPERSTGLRPRGHMIMPEDRAPAEAQAEAAVS
jgi:serine protease AprX